MSREDEFLYYMRRAFFVLTAVIIVYGVGWEPKYLIMLPILLLACWVAISGIVRDRTRP